MKNLVILGAGYGGMAIITRLLSKELPQDILITLIDLAPYHYCKTKFYALAAGTIKEKHVYMPLPEHPQINHIQSKVTKIDLEKKQVILENKDPIQYDNLIIGLGCEDNYDHVPGAKEHSYSIQSFSKAKKTYEAIRSLAPGSTVSIIGGGLSGVELASELYEARPDLKIKIYDRGSRILSSFPENISTHVENWFDNHNIDMIINANITRIEKNVLYNYNEPIESDLIIWTAGIQPNKVVRDLDVEKNRNGQIILTQYHHIPGNENVFVVGDCAALPHSPSAQLAEGQGEQIADVLWKKWNNEPLPEQMPPIKLKGILGSLGRKDGFGIVADLPMTGRVPRLLKSGVMWMYKHHNG